MRHFCASISQHLLSPRLGIYLLVLSAPFGGACQDTFVPLGKVTREGVTIELSAKPVDPSKPPGNIREQEDYTLRFTISDSSSGLPVRGTNLAAWMDRLSTTEPPDAGFCKSRIHSLLGGNVFSRADVDLNAYHVLVLNQDPSITVVDPLFGFGNTKLLALIPLKSPGEDWALTSDQSRLFVSQPDAKALAVVDAVTWKVLRHIATGGRPSVVRLQPNERYVWIAVQGDEPSASGVLVVDRSDLHVAGNIHTGPAPGALAFSPDNRHVFVTDRSTKSVSIIDVANLTKLAEVTAPSPLVAVSFSPLSHMAYATGEDGSITVVDAVRRESVHKIQLQPGIGEVRFAPGGRWGVIANPEKNLLHVLDASSGRIVQTGTIDKAPNRIYFSSNLAFVERRDSEIVLMIPLTELGRENQPFSPADFPAGQHAFGKIARDSTADRIVPVPGENAVLIANPADKTIYFYEEGMAAPQGQFSNYGHEARAVLVVDHSLRQRAPGTFETTARIRQAGNYLVPIALASPSIAMCLQTTVDLNPEVARARPAAATLRVEPLLPKEAIRSGQSMALRFRLVDAQTGSPYTDAGVRVLTMLTPGSYQRRDAAEHEGSGVYRLLVTPSSPGTWLVFVECLSRGLTFGTSGSFAFEVSPQETK